MIHGFFLSVLIGPAFKNESGDDYIESILDFGYAGGLFVESNKFVFGASLDAPQNLILRLDILSKRVYLPIQKGNVHFRCNEFHSSSVASVF